MGHREQSSLSPTSPRVSHTSATDFRRRYKSTVPFSAVHVSQPECVRQICPRLRKVLQRVIYKSNSSSATKSCRKNNWSLSSSVTRCFTENVVPIRPMYACLTETVVNQAYQIHPTLMECLTENTRQWSASKAALHRENSPDSAVVSYRKLSSLRSIHCCVVKLERNSPVLSNVTRASQKTNNQHFHSELRVSHTEH